MRQKGVHRGIGFASFIEVTNPSAAFYGVGGARISSQDGATVRLDATGTVVCQTSVTEQGQGTEAIIAQVVATAFGVPLERVRVILGDTDVTPYGGGTWASRAAGIGGEAALQAGKALRENVVAVAGAILQAAPNRSTSATARSSTPTPAASACRSRSSRASPISGPTRCRPASRRSSSRRAISCRRNIPSPSPTASRPPISRSTSRPASSRLLRHWVVEDCGTIINPQLVDEQIRGGVVQGLGPALFEHCLYDERGQLLNGSMMDYLVPMAPEMPDIEVGHVVSPTAESELGAKGAGEAGTAGAAGRGDERGERRARAARCAHHRYPDHAGARAARAREGLLITSPRASFKA